MSVVESRLRLRNDRDNPLVGGKLAVWSELDSGTEMELTISAAIAYTKPSVANQSMYTGQET